jgi:hypothetical protein
MEVQINKACGQVLRFHEGSSSRNIQFSIYILVLMSFFPICLQKHDIPHGEHIHRRDYDLCIWCEAKAEVDRNVALSPSGIPPGLRLKKKT